MTRQQAEVLDKRRYLRQEYGGLMRVKDLTRELGYKDTRAAKKWAVANEIRAIELPGQAGKPSLRYDTDQVAKVLMARMFPAAAFE